MAEEQLKNLKRKRGTTKGQLTQVRTFLEKFNIETDDIEIVRSRIKTLEGARESFYVIQDKIEELSDMEEADQVERDGFEETYCNLLARCNSLIKRKEAPLLTRQPSRESTPDSAASVARSNASGFGFSGKINLPKQQMPTFNGDYTQWIPYFDAMGAIVFNNAEMPDIQKFHVTKQTLTGPALALIQNVPASAEGYQIIYDLLVGRFNVPKLIVDTHFKKMLEVPAMTKESGVAIQAFHDAVVAHNRAIENCKGNNYDALLIFLLAQKFDPTTTREWKTYTKGKKVVKLSDLTKFLEDRCSILEDEIIHASAKGSQSKDASAKKPQPRAVNQNLATLVATDEPEQIHCHFCKSSHRIFACQAFRALSPEDRYTEIKKLGLCVICLVPHNGRCRSGFDCHKCHGKHNTLLHFNNRSNNRADNPTATAPNGQGTSSQAPIVYNEIVNVTQSSAANSLVLLMTANVKVRGKDGNYHECRALIDTAAQSNYITEELADKLGLDKQPTEGTASGLQATAVALLGEVHASVKSRLNNFEIVTPCYVVKQITGKMPQVPIDKAQIAVPGNLALADPEYHRPRRVEMLLSMRLYKKVIRDGCLDLGDDKPCLVNSVFGWLVGGEAPVHNVAQRQFNSFCALTTIDVQQQLEKFFLLEEVSSARPLSEQEAKCEKHFVENVERADNGQLIVKYPTREVTADFSHTKQAAISRLKSMERRFARDPELKQQYIDFMREYIQMGHMSRVESIDDTQPSCYLPHHAVLKRDSETTKLRSVFDGSCKARGKLSLNDTLLTGPVIQDDLFDILCRFRFHTYVIGADVAKMYRNVWVHPSQRQLQLIVWREAPEEPMRTFALNTVTYGLAPSSFLATRCLHYAADENKEQFPIAESVIKRDLYVDDLLSGADTIEEVRAIKNDVETVLGKIGFHLRKWISNEPAVFLDNEQREDSYLRKFSEDLKTLGLSWNPRDDVLQYKINLPTAGASVTKRHILSVASQTFDPLGLVGPIIVEAKVILQKLWQANLDWDDAVPEQLANDWAQYINQLNNLGKITIPRHVIQPQTVRIELHGFCDASEVAYGACIYLRSWDTAGACSSRLLTAKSRVAPLKKVTLPRLEMCSALTLARLTAKALEAATRQPDDLYFWGDSTIALAWIYSESSHWKTFIANRVSEVQTLTDKKRWGHVVSEENSADIISRAKPLTNFETSQLWWQGPEWLREGGYSRSTAVANPPEEVPERKVVSPVVLFVATDFTELIHRYSTINTLRRVTAWCLRFVSNARKIKSEREFGVLSAKEIKNANNNCIKAVQAQSFGEELYKLRAGDPVKTGPLASLNVFLDEEGLIRVGGRLQKSALPYSQQHGIVLPSKHHFTDILIREEHTRLLHSGQLAVLASLRAQYWILSGQAAVRRITRSCVRCFRTHPSPYEQIMGSLPSARVNGTRPFEEVGVDCGGPFTIKISRNVKGKAYLLVLVCMSYKAVHLEVVSELSTEAFLNAFKRFVARRGIPRRVHSDNGKNFEGANNELKRVLELFRSKEYIKKFGDTCIERGIEWVFIPPYSPHFGGLWEAAIKSAKTHWRKIVGPVNLTFEHLTTVFTEIEGVMNSRPLTPVSSDAKDLEPLTPGHFLKGNALTALPQPDFSGTPENRLTAYGRLVRIREYFWERWSKEYLQLLQPRNKWRLANNKLTVGSMVLVSDLHLPSLEWPMGRIVELYPGNDGVARVALIKTQKGNVKRAITKLSILPISDN